MSIAVGELNRMQDMLDLYLGCRIENIGLVIYVVTVDSCLGTLKVHLATEHQVLTVKLDLDFILELMSLVVAVVTDGNY